MLPVDTLVEEHHAQIRDAIRVVASRRRLTPDERDDFAPYVHVQLLENDCARLRKYQGRGTFHAFLVTVVIHLFLDYRNAKWGRWRPSAEAKRLGPIAEQLEKLIVRDRLTTQEALTTLRTNFQIPDEDETLDEILAQLPLTARRSFVNEEALAAMPAPDGDAETNIRASERRAHAARTFESLRRALASLQEQDRLLVQLRFEQGLTVPQIARALAIPPPHKRLYRDVHDLKAYLRDRLVADDITAAEVLEWLGGPERLPAEDEAADETGENGEPRPSA